MMMDGLRLSDPRIQEVAATIRGIRAEQYPDLPPHFTCFAPEYAGYHAPRIALLVRALELSGAGRESTILDVGPTLSSIVYRQALGCRIDSLSFSPDGPTPYGQNFQFDLNLAQSESTWRTDLGGYSHLMFTEVIEHLHTAPRLALQYLKSLMAPGGYIFIQTPNAVCLKHRIQMLAGKHPFEQISEATTSPNHFRESTLPELVGFTKAAGLEVIHSGHYNYFDPRFDQKNQKSSWKRSLWFKANDYFPGTWKRGMMVVARRT